MLKLSFSERVSRAFIILLPLVAFMLYAKHETLVHEWALLAATIGRDATWPAHNGFTPLERASFYVPEFILIGLLPFVFAYIRPWIIATISVVASFLIFVQINSIQAVGTFLTNSLMQDMVRWGLAHPEFIWQYGGGIVKLIALIIATVLCVFVAKRYAQFRKNWLIGAVCIAISLGATVANSVQSLDKTIYHKPIAVSGISALLPTSRAISTNISKDELKDQYSDLAAIPSPDMSYFGKAKDYDVLIFIMESAPKRYAGLGADLPSMMDLSKESFVATNHHTTFPYTARAIFSMLTSMYPPNITLEFNSSRNVPGLVSELKEKGYTSQYYLTHWFETPQEDNLFAGIGFDDIVFSNTKRGFRSGQENMKKILSLDLAALDALKKGISKADGKLLTMFAPQIGHAPWADIVSGGAITDLAERDRNIIRLQDSWLGEIIEVLKATGRYDRTIIVVTGDHGIRTNVEDPRFLPVGLLDAYSFEVPLLIRVPGLEARTINHLTSHIDIAPTVLSLLGIAAPESFQGSEIWNAGLKQRATYLWADDYLGASGWHHNGTFTVKNLTVGAVFKGEKITSEHLARSSDTVMPLDTMREINRAWWQEFMPAIEALD